MLVRVREEFVGAHDSDRARWCSPATKRARSESCAPSDAFAPPRLLTCHSHSFADNHAVINGWVGARWFSLLFALALFSAPAAGTSADTNAAWLAEHYTKYEHRIPMRDGVRLFTRVYVPKDDSQRWPIILTRTPYSLKPYGTDNYTDPIGSFRTLAKDRFILVTQDVRGRYGSEGEYVHVRPFNPNKGPKDIDESSDAFDTIDWL